ncbi:DUF192 domain-containing protein, partial [bacterium]|nr:DUF192 domain-containing protein [bacterium]
MKRVLSFSSISRLLFSSLFLFLLGCQPDAQSDTRARDEVQALEHKASRPNLHLIKVDGVPLEVEIAQDPETLASGLMYKERLPENEGMLFVFESTRVLSFWMRNTFIPLDIAFIDDSGSIVDIQRMEALDESKQYISKVPALYALEVNVGWFQRNNVKVGSKV